MAEKPSPKAEAEASRTAEKPKPRSIETKEEAMAAIATFSKDEMKQLFKGMLNSNYSWLPLSLCSHLVAFLLQRQESEAPPPPETAEKCRENACVRAEAKVLEALESITKAGKSLNGCGWNLKTMCDKACRRLQAQTEPLALGAAEAERILGVVHSTVQRDPVAKKAIMNAEKDVRDVVVLRCFACVDDPKDRAGFLEILGEAYEHQLHEDVKEKLLLAYHKDPIIKQCGFPSNNRIKKAALPCSEIKKQKEQEGCTATEPMYVHLDLEKHHAETQHEEPG